LFVQFVECRLVENVGRRFRPVESQKSDRVVEDFASKIFGCRGHFSQLRLSQRAPPCPPPTHRATNARLRCRRSSSLSAVNTRRVPETPTGCPRAIAPPLTFNISSGISP